MRNSQVIRIRIKYRFFGNTLYISNDIRFFETHTHISKVGDYSSRGRPESLPFL